ncbi:DUF1206 domain-containing protein [Aquimarina sp. 2-A2]|uniref:Uncharacterized protein DUF1206 n=1 Tax=Aquimarina intermedia TaxID=350814 RepID=A0A5S5BXF4_9FLAO|nr:DUF1206 domain-containing protein [Aquimarina intermedia]TYP70986.1 uncharacterized protein DUF1206 [Aquimarina intermedia]
MDHKIKKIAKVGFGAKGLVYALTGILTLLAAFNAGGQKAGKLQVIEFLEQQSFGKIILAVLGLGLFCYAFWRFIQSIKNPEGINEDAKGSIKRVGFFISGIVYTGLGGFALWEIFNESSSSGTSKNGILSSEYGQYILIVIGAAMGIKAAYQFIKAIKGDFLDQFDLRSITDPKRRKFIKNMGYAGLVSRGIVISIIAYFFLRAGLGAFNSATTVKGTSDAFSFIQQNSSGPWLLGLVSAGLICYGIYMFSKIKYRKFK